MSAYCVLAAGGAPSDHLDRAEWFCGGYASPEIARIKREGAPFECCGPAGTVVLWRELDRERSSASGSDVFGVRLATAASLLPLWPTFDAPENG